jgi:hypothetical protein
VSQQTRAEELRALERRIEDLQRLLEDQDRSVSEALERMGVLDEQGIGDRRFSRRMEALVCHRRPVVVGPWTGEVGFELIYWIPFVRWVLSRYHIPADRLWVVSRGGTRSWYGDLAARYVDAFEFFSPDEFRTATARSDKKQRRVGPFDVELVERVTSAHALGRPELLHPGLMYRLFMPFWKDLASIARVEKYATYERLAAPDDRVLEELPGDYVAVRFYFSECFPDTPANRAFVSSTVDAISRQAPVVLLNTPFAVDDHRDAESAGGRVHTVGSQMAPASNLAVQTAVIARARAFVGTYGGYSYLAPFCGVPSLAFYSEPTFKVHHLQVAQQAFARLGGPTVVPLNVSAVPVLRLALSGGLVTAS